MFKNLFSKIENIALFQYSIDLERTAGETIQRYVTIKRDSIYYFKYLNKTPEYAQLSSHQKIQKEKFLTEYQIALQDWKDTLFQNYPALSHPHIDYQFELIFSISSNNKIETKSVEIKVSNIFFIKHPKHINSKIDPYEIGSFTQAFEQKLKPVINMPKCIHLFEFRDVRKASMYPTFDVFPGACPASAALTLCKLKYDTSQEQYEEAEKILERQVSIIQENKDFKNVLNTFQKTENDINI
jgi:hypothetical protein